jgi:hypothetical protein
MVVDYHELRQRFHAALEAAARAHESGDLAAIEAGYDELDALLPHNDDPAFDKLHTALEFWDGWIDARNHDWLYYERIQEEDWPRLARGIVDDLRRDREISDERALQRFDSRRRTTRPSVWARLRGIFRGGSVV